MDNPCSITCSIFTCLFLIICCLCAGLVLLLGLVPIDSIQIPNIGAPQPAYESTPLVIRPTPAPKTPVPQTPGETAPAETPDTHNPSLGSQVDPLYDPAAVETLLTLQEAQVRAVDLHELAGRLRGIYNIPETIEEGPVMRQVGDQKDFWVTSHDTNQTFQVSASLQYITEHLYFWIEDGVRFNRSDLEKLAVTFEESIYPTNREFFGSEWKPGIDGDPHLYVLYARGIGERVAGYFSSNDSYHPLAHPYSNGHELFLMSADHYSLRDAYLYGVLAHEFQHMIHWYQDRNEETWLNEGFSELAAYLNGYKFSGFDRRFAANPDIQLNDWPNDPAATTPHYGASFLFLLYFLDRFGEEATKSLIAEQENGLTSIDTVLGQLDIRDPLSGELLGADQVFMDWAAASYLQDPEVGDGRYTYLSYDNPPEFGPTETISRCPTEVMTRDVRQYGSDYIRITCQGAFTLNFEGSVTVRVVPSQAYSGNYFYWSNKGDESNMSLTRSFDFSQHSGPLTLSYRTWYDIEQDYDYLYLLASVDGETWQIMETPSGRDENPSGNSYGWAYNGRSTNGTDWIQEQVDLSAFAGQEVLIRFEYITDAAVNGEGFLLDDVEIPELGYFTDFEADDGGWEADGFVRIQNMLPQVFQLALIKVGSETTVETFVTGPEAAIEIPFEIGGDVREVIIAVSGATRFTREPAAYRFGIAP
jgi:immune inhibitor A